MGKFYLLFMLLFIFIFINAFPQQAINNKSSNLRSNNPQSIRNRPHFYMPDTSEQGLIKDFRNKIDNSEIVIDAEVVSMVSKWDYSKNGLFPDGSRKIYTIITFRVYNWIKGPIKDNEITFYNPGGKIGNNSVYVTHIPYFYINERAIFFFGNKEPNTYVIDNGSIPIFGAENGKHGELFIGSHRLNAETYVKIIKKSVSDSTLYPYYIHLLKTGRKRFSSGMLRYKNKQLHPDSISIHQEVMQKWWKKHEQKMKVIQDSLKGGVK